MTIRNESKVPNVVTDEMLRRAVKHKMTKQERQAQMVSFIMSGLGDDYPDNEPDREKKRKEILERHVW